MGMKATLKRSVRGALKSFGLGITNYEWLESLKANSKVMERNSGAYEDLELLRALPEEQAGKLLKILPDSQAQFRQDLFVLSETNFKQGGFFVEFGATDGHYDSNTYMLEKFLGWKGIVAEPALRWHAAPRQNRTCAIETDCVWRRTGESLTFNEAKSGTLSTIDQFSGQDLHRDARSLGQKYSVKTISLDDLLEKYAAPEVIDYLSIDTEGSEFEILSHYSFEKHPIRIITVEHNYSPQRDNIFNLLTEKGYKRVYEGAFTVR